MYKEHSCFISPENEEAKIWRYMDFTKFISLIDREALFFTRSDLFNDPFEGSITKMDYMSRMRKKYASPFPSLFDVLPKMNELRKLTTFINCWHLNEEQSEAMWKLYITGNEGLAIQSTYRRLKECFNTNRDIYIGKVSYGDYNREMIIQNSRYTNFLHKKNCYSHERELRAIVSDSEFNNLKPTHGYNISVDIPNLIEKVYIHPSAPSWYVDLIKSLMNRFNLKDIPVVKSSIYDNPLF